MDDDLDEEQLDALFRRRLAAPLDVLELLVAVRSTLDRLEELVVEDARRHFASWEHIGAALGISRQAAHRRHREHVIR